MHGPRHNDLTTFEICDISHKGHADFVICDTHLRPIPGHHHSYAAALRHVRTLQGLPTCHDLLVDQGAFVWTHYDADFEDIGDGESGPMLVGHPAYDVYAGESHTLVFQDGVLVQSLAIDWNEQREWERLERLHGSPDYSNIVTFRDEDGSWYSSNTFEWTNDRRQATHYTDAEAHVIANAFNQRLRDFCGRAQVIDVIN